MDMIVRIARIVIPGYDIHHQSGIPENIPITAQTAAEQVVKDIITAGRYLQLIELLIKIDTTGYMGREYPLLYMRDLIKTILAEGYSYDSVTGLFMENAQNQISSNWGRLVPGDEFQLALLRLDIVKNSELVRQHDKRAVEAAYGDLRNMVSQALLPRMGRLWFWEGDGCLAAFVFGKKERAAVLAGMEILNNLFFYNRLSNILSSPLRVRLAVHGGPVKYAEDPVELKKNETLREIIEMESTYGTPDTLIVSSNVFLSIDQVIQDRFSELKRGAPYKLRQYEVGVEQ